MAGIRRVGLTLTIMAVVWPGTALGDLRAAPEPGTWVPDGPVSSVVPGGARTFVAGDFTQVGPFTGPGVATDPTTGTAGPYPQVTGGRITDAEPDGAGGTYIVGTFTKVGAVAQRYAAHVRADGTVDPAFTPAVSATGEGPIFLGGITSVAVGGGRVYLGGDISSTRDGQRRAYVLAVDAATGTLDLGFDARPVYSRPYSDPIPALHLAGGRLYVATADGITFGGSGAAIVSLDAATGALDGTFSTPAPTYGSGTRSSYRELDVEAGTVYASGFFDHVGTDARAQIVALDGTTGAVTPWTAAAPPEGVGAIDATADKVWFARGHTSGGSPNTARVAAFDRATGALSGVGADVTNSRNLPAITTVRVVGTHVYFGGAFDTAGGSTRRNAASITTSGTLESWDPDLNAPVAAIAAAAGTSVYVGGRFASVRGTARPGVAALRSDDGTLDTSWSPTILNGSSRPRIYAAATGPSDQLLLAGSFQSIGGQSRSVYGAISMTGNGSAATAFAPASTSSSSGAFSFATVGSSVYLGGSVTFAGGRRLAKVDGTTGALDTSFTPTFGGGPGNTPSVRSILPTSSGLMVGGQFATAGGAERRGIAMLDPATGALVPAFTANLGTSAGDAALDLVPGNPGETVVSGLFSAIGGTARPSLAAIDTATGVLRTSFAPAFASGARAAAVVPQGLLFGAHSSLNVLQAVDLDSGTQAAWSPRPGALATDIAYDAARRTAWVVQGDSDDTFRSPTVSPVLRYLDEAGLVGPRVTGVPSLPDPIAVGDRISCTPATFSGTPAPTVTTTMYTASGTIVDAAYTVTEGDRENGISCFSTGENAAATAGSETVRRDVGSGPGAPSPPPTPTVTATPSPTPSASPAPTPVVDPARAKAARTAALKLARRALSAKALRTGAGVRLATSKALRLKSVTVSRKVGKRTRTIATSARRSGKLVLRATKAGRGLVKAGARVTVTVKGTDVDGKAVTATAIVKLRR